MNTLQTSSWRNILSRAGWSVLWGFSSAIPVAQLAALFAEGQISALEQLLLSGVGGGAAALLSFIKTLSQEKLGIGASDGDRS